MASPWTSVPRGAPFSLKSGMRSFSVDGSSTAPESMWAPVSRAFSRTAMASGSPPFSFCSCASRNAADMPADPPPTIKTSTSSVSRSATLLVQFRDHRGDHFEQVAGDAVIGDLEDRRLGILVDRDDGARAFHPDEMLDRAGDAEREIELGRHGLPRAADLAIHRQPAGVADRTRGRDLGAHRLRELLRELQVLLTLDAAPNRGDAFGLREIDRLLRFFERRFGLLADPGCVDGDRRLAHGCRGRAVLDRVSAERTNLERGEVRSVDSDVGLQLALEHGTHVAAALHRDAVGDERPPDPRGQR